MIEMIQRLLRLEKQVEDLKRLLVHDPLNAGKAKLTPIVGGSIEVVRPWVLVTPESGTTDDLDSITGGADGKMVVLAVANDGDTITVTPYSLSGGNIDLRGSGNGRVLSDIHDSIFLIYRGDTGHWEQVGPDTLNSLVGVALTTPADGDALVYDEASGNWINGAGGGSGGAVDSVNGQTGAVVLDSDDIGEGASNLYFSAAEAAKLAGIEAGAEVNTVDSVNGQTGAVVLDADEIDETASRVWFTPAEESKLGGVEALADVTDAANVGGVVNAAAADTPLDADKLAFWDVVDGILKSLTWANLKTTLKSYFDTLYAAIPTTGTWSPVIVSANADHTSTYTTNTGRWTRMGDVVLFRITIAIDTITSAGTGATRIDVPFTTSGISESVAAVAGPALTAGTVQYCFQISSAAFGSILQNFDNAANVNMPVTALAAGDTIRVSGFFFVD